jgi:hypothetical protein
MKNLVKISMIILAITFAGCKKDKNPLDGGGNVKLSPPSWLHGSWSVDPDGKHEALKFTSNDVIIGGVNLAQLYPYSGIAGYSWTIKETKNTSTLYEITASAKAGGQSASATLSFKKIDNNTIEYGSSEDGKTIDDYETFYKIK